MSMNAAILARRGKRRKESLMVGMSESCMMCASAEDGVLLNRSMADMFDGQMEIGASPSHAHCMYSSRSSERARTKGLDPTSDERLITLPPFTYSISQRLILLPWERKRTGWEELWLRHSAKRAPYGECFVGVLEYHLFSGLVSQTQKWPFSRHRFLHRSQWISST